MRLDFSCGHTLTAEDGAAIEPTCPACSCRQVSHVQVRPPRFVGSCTGPHAEFVPDVKPVKVDLAPSGPLPLKQHKDKDHA